MLKARRVQVICGILLVLASLSCSHPQTGEEIAFQSGPFAVVGELTLPEGRGPHPVVIFVHGDGPNDRTSGGTYLPIMERMLLAGYATFAWDKPGTGESTGQIDPKQLQEERAQIVLDAIAMLKDRQDVDSKQIGLWGISQAGYVMPKVLSQSDDVAFLIAVSCPGEAGVDQGAYFVAQQARCVGLPSEDVEQVEHLLGAIERAQKYEEYVHIKEQLDSLPIHDVAKVFGFTRGIKPRGEWHAGNLEGEYFWDPMEIIEQTTIPALIFFGEKDTQVDPYQGAQAYQDALQRAGNSNFRVELIPGVDHHLVLSETGCFDEIEKMSARARINYAPEYLDLMEDWLRELQFGTLSMKTAVTGSGRPRAYPQIKDGVMLRLPSVAPYAVGEETIDHLCRRTGLVELEVWFTKKDVINRVDTVREAALQIIRESRGQEKATQD